MVTPTPGRWDRPPAAGLPRGLIVLLGLAAAVITAAGIYATSWLIGPIFLALTMVLVVSPVRTRLLRLGVPSWLATAVLILGVYAVVLGLALVMVFSVAQLATELPKYADRFDEIGDGVAHFLKRLGIGDEPLQAASAAIDPGRIADLALSLVSSVAGLATNVVFVLSLLLFMALETTASPTRIALIAQDRPQVANALGSFVRGTRRYMGVTTLFGLVIALLDTVALVLLGVPLAVPWGLLAFITNYIPNIGFIIGVIPPTLLALLSGGWQLAAVVVVVYVVINFVVQSLTMQLRGAFQSGTR